MADVVAEARWLDNLAAVSDEVSSPVPIDLDSIERDLADVETALARLDAGTYWTDEVTGDTLSDELLAERPTSRRAGAPGRPGDSPTAG
ncbi:MAG: hypothetical protein RI958_1504 [Actinomycetota bacterium]|jgi:hypothetical protein